ncbi:hypothetical protein KDL01_10060 [Actinospica durhamensis]|uniref:Uncharacterized protein n=1 Tax=Actinospica durhamensis TaxID=1508375 RepID=A0A941IM06_9ACTN|nr:hypothetical protein [Actinospica durhamensis]MBR7833610.1 hypothetical protein [Actinospica durhamensis]
MYQAAANGSSGTPWWGTLAVTLGTIIVTTWANLLVSRRQARTQVDLKALELDRASAGAAREQKAAAFHRFLEAADDAWQGANDLYAAARPNVSAGRAWRRRSRGNATPPAPSYREATRHLVSPLTSAYLKLSIVADEQTRTAADTYMIGLNDLMQRAGEGRWQDETSAARNALLEAMRAELGTDEPGKRAGRAGAPLT